MASPHTRPGSPHSKAQDFKKVEKEIMEDSIGYLQQTDRYTKLLVFIYDESSSVQEHGTTRLDLKGKLAGVSAL